MYGKAKKKIKMLIVCQHPALFLQPLKLFSTITRQEIEYEPTHQAF